jgi:hypothetical protein
MNLKEKFNTEMTKQLEAGVRQVDVSFTHRGRVYCGPHWSIHKGAYLVYSSPVGKPSKTVLKYI